MPYDGGGTRRRESGTGINKAIMPTRISSPSLSRAIDHLCRYGDTDVFPHLIEIVFLSERKDAVIGELSTLDLESFNPAQAIETISPKSRYGFRIVHQLMCLETLLFTAATFEIANDLEKLKRPLDEQFGPFAYRFASGDDASVFKPDRTYRHWLEFQATKVQEAEYEQVICTDIADFYQRIYLHRIENCLETATANKGVKRFIERLVKQVRSRQSHGIPVGGTASRLIAEAVLADTDSALADEQIEFTRFVDDFRIFVKPRQSAYSILAFFADQLAASEGLALNAHKTRLYSSGGFHTFVVNQLGDAFKEAEEGAIEALIHALYFDEKVSEEDISKLRALNLLEMLEEALSPEVWDFGKIKAIFRALRLAPDPNSMDFITEKFELFLPFMKELVLYLEALKRSYNVDAAGLQDKIWAEITGGAASSVPAIRVWLLELFVRGIVPIELRQLAKLTAETLDNRQGYLIRGIKGDANFFRRHKARFDERNSFEKSAFMIGATCLRRDELETWVSAVKQTMTRPLDHLFCDWIKTKAGKLSEILQARTDLLKNEG